MRKAQARKDVVVYPDRQRPEYIHCCMVLLCPASLFFAALVLSCQSVNGSARASDVVALRFRRCNTNLGGAVHSRV